MLKALLQRVSKASVMVGDEVVGEIGNGLVVLIGVKQDDTTKDIDYLVDKIVKLRIFSDDAGKFNLSVMDRRGGILVISQFTLMADTKKGRRPSFVTAASPETAIVLFNKFIEQLRSTQLEVKTGRFQQHMLVEIHNDGPVTIMLDSRDKTS